MAIGSEAFVDGEVRFGLLDYFVLALTLIISSGIGIYYRFTGGKQKTAQEYLLGDKNMSVVWKNLRFLTLNIIFQEDIEKNNPHKH